MKKTMLALALIGALIPTACGQKEFTPDYDSAIGMIIVNDRETIAQEGRVYADYADHQYTFDLDAAVIYFFRYDAETSYAGSDNLTSTTFIADIDGDSVGAMATVSYANDEAGENTVTAYYLYFDGEGLYFEPSKPFTSASVDKGAVIEGADCDIQVTITPGIPTEYFTIACYGGDIELQTETMDPRKFEDCSRYPLPDGTDRVEIASYNESGEMIDQAVFRQGEMSYVVAYDAGGQIMGAKTLYLEWPE